MSHRQPKLGWRFLKNLHKDYTDNTEKFFCDGAAWKSVQKI
jgi:hypothetical protein